MVGHPLSDNPHASVASTLPTEPSFFLRAHGTSTLLSVIFIILHMWQPTRKFSPSNQVLSWAFIWISATVFLILRSLFGSFLHAYFRIYSSEYFQYIYVLLRLSFLIFQEHNFPYCGSCFLLELLFEIHFQAQHLRALGLWKKAQGKLLPL